MNFEGLELRPRFSLVVPHAPETLAQHLQAALKQHPDLQGKVVGDHVVLKMRPHQAHFWSPQLTLDLEAHANGAFVRGLFAPNPAVWTLFIFIYSAIGVLSLVGGLYGLSLWTLGKPAPALWFFPGGAALALLVYFAGRFGRQLGEPQMQVLRGFLQDNLRQLFQEA
ncbi:MAG: hypothetical protein D6722_23770 [Bacteroidetes bacterium]|nr:MAG: hypothetical protein D6722_23770 [Bacteroidota bacterium]